MTTELIFLILGFISMLIPTGITILVIVLPYMERKAAAKAVEAKEAAEREERQNRQRYVKALIDTAMDYDFGRDITAGKETTSYKDLLSRAKEKAMSME